ncbi:MAG: hypothetical protein K8W52_01360 [Deltaproteobacteria bacterium]|nr:hypothetical protein [Deltaproteobacteria bacterium]
MARLPITLDRRLWRLPHPDPKKAYSAYRASPRRIEVLEQGKRVLHREAVDPDAPGDYVVEHGWLIHRTYPRAAAEHAQEQQRAADLARRKATALAKAERAPAFQAYLAQLERELGAPRIPKTLGHPMRAYPAPRDARCAVLIQQARAAGGAATLYLAPWARELRVVVGRVGQLAELFLGPHRLEQAFDALDRDAGLTLEYVATDHWQFALHVDRPPKAKARYADVLEEDLLCEDAVGLLRRERQLRMGALPRAWKRRARRIKEPITFERDA